MRVPVNQPCEVVDLREHVEWCYAALTDEAESVAVFDVNRGVYTLLVAGAVGIREQLLWFKVGDVAQATALFVFESEDPFDPELVVGPPTAASVTVSAGSRLGDRALAAAAAVTIARLCHTGEVIIEDESNFFGLAGASPNKALGKWKEHEATRRDL